MGYTGPFRIKSMTLLKNSLVLYKQAPALIIETGEKLELALNGGKSRSVRIKDVVLLHPGPVPAFPDLEKEAPEGQPEEAWKLLQDESPSLSELAELVYGEFTPSTAWLSFKLLNRTPWFRGTPESIEVVDAESVAQRIRMEEEKKEAEQQWTDFIERFKQKKINPETDELFLRDLEMFALGRSKGSRILKTLKKTQTPENAHRVMIDYHVKTDIWNPHPLRLELPMDVPDYSLGELPSDERMDLTNMEAFAIDDEETEDPDDALAWDGTKLWVHVADVAALFPPDSPADQAARERGSSLYLPEVTIPMLPPKAAKLLGLGQNETSPAMSYAFSFDSSFNVTDFSVHLTTIRVTRLSYAEADKRMSREPFRTMKKITDAAARRRYDSGAISINMPEVKVRVDGNGEINITPIPELASSHMVAEAMILAGSYAAKLCLEHDIPIPFAVQVKGDFPEDENPRSENQYEGNSDSKYADYLSEFNRRRGMKRSRMTLKCAPHAGLGLEAYTRVTSPLRRYPDLVTSRQIRQFILDREIESEESVLEGLAAFESRIGSLVQGERRSNFFWKLLWLKRQNKFSTDAWLLDKRERQGYFLIPEIAMETRVPLKEEMKLGSRVKLSLHKVDVPESSVLFRIEET